MKLGSRMLGREPLRTAVAIPSLGRYLHTEVDIVDVSVPAVALVVFGACLAPVLRGLRIPPTEALREG